MKFNLLIILIFGISFSSISQIDPNDIEIVRDSFGVPHIYAKATENLILFLPLED